ncbi:MAG: ribonuclease E activity regulator RraA [Pseudomonadales bacterium]|nr:ribonuclease E activity regulator RraA [Pseudomonadales bacterium]
MSTATAALHDQFRGAVQICRSPLLHYGAQHAFDSPIATIRCLRDDGLICDASRQSGIGRVLVVDAGGVLDCAHVGGHLAARAAKSGWAGIIVNGCVRDIDELTVLPLGIRALGVWPPRAARAGTGSAAIAVLFGEVTFEPEHWLRADRDGLVVMKEEP